MSLALHVIKDREHRALLDRAKLRALEQQTGQSTDDDGSYWLARVAALERVADLADRVMRGKQDEAALREALDVLNGVQAPACRAGDHQVAA
jgi:hypothetical protein